MRDELTPLRWRGSVALVLGAALALRVFLALAAAPQEVSDAGDYRDLAVGLLDRGEYGAIGSSGWNDGLSFRAYRPPGYPFVRAALMVVLGRGAGPALWLNVICELIALALVIDTARRVLDRSGALVAGVIFGTFVLFTASLMTESLSMALWAALGWAVVSGAQRERGAMAVLLGVIAGVAILVRPVSVFWVPVLAWPWMARAPRVPLARLAAFLAPIVVLVGAWTLRNTIVFGSVVWISTNLGVHNAPDFGIPWTRLTALRRTGLSEPEADRALTREILAVAIAHPSETRDAYEARVIDLFAIAPEDCWELGFAREQVYRRSPSAIWLLDWAIVLWRSFHVLGLVGLARAVLDRRLRSRVLAPAFVAFVALQCVLSRGDVRLLAPAIPMLSIFAAQLLRPR